MNSKIIFLLIYIFIISVPGTFSREVYIEQETFFARWGNQPGEIPLYVKGSKAKIFNINKIEYSGPKLFKVDNFGNIYIMLIGYDSQIIKFDTKGNFLTTFQYGFNAFSFAIDENENIFVVAETDEKIKNADIKIFDKYGVFIEESRIEWPSGIKNEIFYYNNNIYDLSGNIIYTYNKKTEIKKPDKLNENKLLIGKINISPGNYDEKIKINSLIINGLNNLGEGKDMKELIIDEIKGHTIKKSAIVGISKTRDIYSVLRITNAQNPGPMIFIILVFDKNGNVLAVIPAKTYELLEPGNIINNFIDIDVDGNIYQLWSTEDGAHITKWSKIKGPFFK